MLRYILLGLCLTPLMAQAEFVCLEGPQGGKCQLIDANGEVFKSRTADRPNHITSTANITPSKSTHKQRRINTQIPIRNKQIANHRTKRTLPRRMITAEQRIKQRAQRIESRFMHRRGMTNVSQLDENSSYHQRRLQSAELRKRLETQE